MPAVKTDWELIKSKNKAIVYINLEFECNSKPGLKEVVIFLHVGRNWVNHTWSYVGLRLPRLESPTNGNVVTAKAIQTGRHRFESMHFMFGFMRKDIFENVIISNSVVKLSSSMGNNGKYYERIIKAVINVRSVITATHSCHSRAINNNTSRCTDLYLWGHQILHQLNCCAINQN